MQAYRAQAILTDSGEITLSNLPFPKGQRVEVIVLAPADAITRPTGQRTAADLNAQVSRIGTSMEGDPSLAPIVLNYDPTEPATEDEWPSSAR